MLGKLIKHDFRALSRILFPLQIGILAASIVASVFMTINLRIDWPQHSGSIAQFALTGVTALIAFIVGLGVVASILLTFLIICVQYYRNLMGDQGYLSFTLPVTTGHILLSKFITGMLWSIINIVVVGVAALIFAVFGTASKGLMNPESLALLRGLFVEAPNLGQYVNMWLASLLMIVCIVLALAETLLQAYFAVTVGGRAMKHKLLASIGMYIALSAGVSTVRTISTLFFSITPAGVIGALGQGDLGAWMLRSVLLWNIVLALALCVVFFLSSRAILKNKLNLQ